jgi:haloacid dehalogenase-like hydrolase
MVRCGMGESPPLAQNIDRVDSIHDSHRDGDIDHVHLVTQVGVAYAESMRGMSRDLLDLMASHWEESSADYEPRRHLMLDVDRSPVLYWWTYDPRIPEPMWFADPLAAALAKAGTQAVLISGGPTEPVSLFAQRFHAIVGGALTLEAKENDCFTGKVACNTGLPAEKRRIAAEYAAQGNIRFAAGDSPNDIALLERAEIKLIVGNAIDAPDTWTNVHRLPVVPTQHARLQLTWLLKALGKPQLTL